MNFLLHFSSLFFPNKQNSWFVEMRKNGIGPTTTGTAWTDTHKSSTINHYQLKQVCQLKQHTIVFTVLMVILMLLNEAQSTVSVTNRLARNVQRNGAHSDKVSNYFSVKAYHSISFPLPLNHEILRNINEMEKFFLLFRMHSLTYYFNWFKSSWREIMIDFVFRHCSTYFSCLRSTFKVFLQWAKQTFVKATL